MTSRLRSAAPRLCMLVNKNLSKDGVTCRIYRRRRLRPIGFAGLSFMVLLFGSLEGRNVRLLGGMVKAHDANKFTQTYTQTAMPKNNNHRWSSLIRVPRGGANRFLPDDKGDYSNIDYGDRETLYEKLNPMSRRGNSYIGTSGGDDQEKKHSSVVYQYFGKSRSRGAHSHQQSQTDDASLNFILLGPNVDHWKTVGQTLALRGFNVMACERMIDKDGDGNPKHNLANQYEDAPELVLEILDALKWNRAVLVGCDDESLLAMETAMMMAPDRVAGLILCGDLTEANGFAMEDGETRTLDSFLHRNLDCPFVIVWDGGLRSVAPGSSSYEATKKSSSPFDENDLDGRCVILGGGSAPHRTKPEYFAWVLARFVEEKLEYHPRGYVGGKMRQAMAESSMKENDRVKMGQNQGGFLRNLNLPFGIDSVVSPEGRLLLGRAIAAAIFYTSCMKVIFVQYRLLKVGVISVKNSVDLVDVLRRKIFQAIGGFVLNFGYIPRLFKFSSRKTEEAGEDGVGSGKGVHTEDKESNGNTSNSMPTSPDVDDTDDSQKEDEDSEDILEIKPSFFLDNIFT
mmetsp:Transcript_13335/g.28012  ORF Transcript_13335/g.28012 Transcript_13335/m.28012 type:complete len:568 (-) Transcript_13335:151-1854(-)